MFLLPNGSAAQGQDAVARAADSLRSDPVYVDPAAERAIGAGEAEQVRRRIESSDAGPMYIAILPASAKQLGGGSAEGVGSAIEQQLRRPGTYAVVVGGSFRVASTDVPGVREQATEAIRAHGGEGVTAVLLDFTDRVGQLRAGERPGSGSGGGTGIGGGAILVPLLLLGGGALLLRGRRRRKAEEAELAELKANVRDDLVALGDDIRALDLDVELAGVDPAAKADYGRAVEAYQRCPACW